MAVVRAQAAALAAGASEIGPIVLLRGIVADYSVREFIKELGLDADGGLSNGVIDGWYGEGPDDNGGGGVPLRGLPVSGLARFAIELAQSVVERLHHPFVEPEHILLAMLQIPDLKLDVDLSGVDVVAFRSALMARQYGPNSGLGRGESSLLDALSAEPAIREMHRLAAIAFEEGRIADFASIFDRDVEYYSEEGGTDGVSGRELLIDVFASVRAVGLLVALETASVLVRGKILIEHGFLQYSSREDCSRWGERTRYCAIWKVRNGIVSIAIFVRY